MLLPDVNVWLALTFDSHIHHPAAKSWFDGLSNDAVCCFCRLTQQGFLPLATNRSVFGNDAVTRPEAWQKYDLFLSDPRVSFAEEPAQIETHWRKRALSCCR
jgi:toxin-antitoxin system PIN domain toxin